MTILAFDLSLSCVGYSLLSEDGKFILNGHIETNDGDITPLRLKHLAKEMKKIKRNNKITKVLIEKGFYRFARSTEQIFRCHGITNLIFSDIEQIEIHATSVRKLVTGHGNINKEQLFEYISKEYPNIIFVNYDEMDSFALGIAFFKQQGVI